MVTIVWSLRVNDIEERNKVVVFNALKFEIYGFEEFKLPDTKYFTQRRIIQPKFNLINADGGKTSEKDCYGYIQIILVDGVKVFEKNIKEEVKKDVIER